MRRIVVIDATKPPDLRKSSPRFLWPVTADFRARLLERLEVRGERQRLIRNLHLRGASIDNLARGALHVTASAMVGSICDYYRWPKPQPTDENAYRRAIAEQEHEEVAERESEESAISLPKQRLATGVEHIEARVLILELGARGHIVGGKVRLPVVEPEGQRPRVRGDCENGPRPCPWWACRHHLWRVDSIDRAGRRHANGSRGDAEVVPSGVESCALDVVATKPPSNETVGDALGVTKERGRQLVQEVTDHVRTMLVARGADGPAFMDPTTYEERLPA